MYDYRLVVNTAPHIASDVNKNDLVSWNFYLNQGVEAVTSDAFYRRLFSFMSGVRDFSGALVTVASSFAADYLVPQNHGLVDNVALALLVNNLVWYSYRRTVEQEMPESWIDRRYRFPAPLGPRIADLVMQSMDRRRLLLLD